jgi:hypothetical protein
MLIGVVVVILGAVLFHSDVLRVVVVVTTGATIPQVEHWRRRSWNDSGAIFHRHLMMDLVAIRMASMAAQVMPIHRPWMMMQMMLMVSRVVIGPGRVKTRLTGRGKSTRFHHSKIKFSFFWGQFQNPSNQIFFFFPNFFFSFQKKCIRKFTLGARVGRSRKINFSNKNQKKKNETKTLPLSQGSVWLLKSRTSCLSLCPAHRQKVECFILPLAFSFGLDFSSFFFFFFFWEFRRAVLPAVRGVCLFGDFHFPYFQLYTHTHTRRRRRRK